MIVDKTCRGFNNIDLKDKYNQTFYIRQSSCNMNDIWLGIERDTQTKDPLNQVDTSKTYSILIDEKLWKQIKKARRLARK